MMMLVFLLKSTACLAIFLAFYKLALEKESMHQFKRFYLLGALLVSFLIPNIVFVEYVEVVQQVSSLETPLVSNGQETTIAQPFVEEATVNWGVILWTIYVLGVLAFAFRFLRNLGQIWQRIRKNPKLKGSFITRVLLAQQLPPHTFFSYIFLNKNQYEAQNIPEEVILHEETHAKQKHSLDILLIESAQIILWFNPLIYLLKSYIKLNHEFLADREVVNNSHDHTHYQNTLLSYLSHDSFEKYQSTGIANAINYSSIKKRFTVMKTNTSKKSIVLRSFLLLPLMALLLFGFSEKNTVAIHPNDLLDSHLELNNSMSDKIQNEIGHINSLSQNLIGPNEGVSKELMDEYISFIESYAKTKTVNFVKYKRAQAIYKLMSDAQRESLKKYPKLPTEIPISNTSFRTPTEATFESFKDQKKYAIWIDGNHVSNTVLNTYTANKIVYYTDSYVYKNARSTKFPQEHQVHLYTSNGFKKTFQEANITEYKKQSSLYSDAISKFLNGNRSDNSELRIKKAQLDPLYNSFTEQEKEEYGLLPPPPVPSMSLKSNPLDVSQTNSQDSIIIGEAIEIKINYKGQLMVQNDLVKLEDLKTYLSKINKHLDFDQRKKVVRSVIQVEANTPKDVIQKVDQILTEYGSATINIVGPETSTQSSATREEMKEYNALAKKYNEMDHNNMVIKKNEVVRLKVIYGKMSKKQREDAEPFPNFPPPPPAPSSTKPPMPPSALKKVSETKPNVPPAPPIPQTPMEHIKEMAAKGATFMLNGKEISAKKAIEVIKNNDKINIDSRGSDDGHPVVKLSVKPIVIEN